MPNATSPRGRPFIHPVDTRGQVGDGDTFDVFANAMVGGVLVVLVPRGPVAMIVQQRQPEFCGDQAEVFPEVERQHVAAVVAVGHSVLNAVFLFLGDLVGPYEEHRVADHRAPPLPAPRPAS